MRDLYIRQNLSHREIADRLDANHKTVRRWRRRFGLEKPWKDESILREMYIEDDLTQSEIADRFNCKSNTVSKWIRKFDIETPEGADLTRNATKSLQNGHATFYTERRGYERWDEGNDGSDFYVHRLLAIATFGPNSVKGQQVHHKNGIPWDNRPENLEVVSNSDHQQMHGRGDLWAER